MSEEINALIVMLKHYLTFDEGSNEFDPRLTKEDMILIIEALEYYKEID